MMAQEQFFDSLYQEMYELLLHYAENALEYHHALAEEAVQETFRVCWTKMESVMTMENPRGWLFATLKNVIRNIRRNQARFANLLLMLSAAYSMEAPAASERLSLDLEYGDLKNDPDYLLLKEFVLEHCSIREMAQARGITIAACKKRIQRAKERLRKYFEENCS